MTAEQELQTAYDRGVEAGRIETRLSSLEATDGKQTVALDKMSEGLSALVGTVQLLSQDIENRAQADKQLREADKIAREDTARAVREEKDNAAQVVQTDKETTALALANRANIVNTAWTPRNGWSTLILASVGIIGLIAAVYFGLHGQTHSPTVPVIAPK